jgi:RNA polymerase sigma-70 factor (ECF subfamily)
MLFAVCHPRLPADAQVALALKTLCGFSVAEVAQAFLTTPDTITKRLYRAKEKIRQEGLPLEFPPADALPARLEAVLRCIYLLFNEGYYSASPDAVVRRDLCREALRLGLLLLDAPATRQPAAGALVALMCFHASRLDGRLADDGALLPWHAQDRARWHPGLLAQGVAHLNAAATGPELTTYHLEAMIAYHHTQPDSPAKWPTLLHLFDELLARQPGPLVALSRAYVLSRAASPAAAIAAVRQIDGLECSGLYHALLGELYEELDCQLAAIHWQQALDLTPEGGRRALVQERLRRCLGQS